MIRRRLSMPFFLVNCKDSGTRSGHPLRIYNLTLLRAASHWVATLICWLVTRRAAIFRKLHNRVSDVLVFASSGRGNRDKASSFPWAVVNRYSMS